MFCLYWSLLECLDEFWYYFYKMKTKLFIVIQFLLFVVVCLHIYSWSINIENTSIAYNKYETFLMMKKNEIAASRDIDFIREEALDAIEIIRANNRRKHKISDQLFTLLIVQVGLLLVIFLSGFWLKEREE